MVDLYVVIDLSGSMNTMGKSVVAASVLQALSSLNDLHFHHDSIRLHKKGWDGGIEGFRPIAQWCARKPTVLLTDGHALYDNCRNRDCKAFFRDNSKNLFVVLCGADAFDVSKSNEFKELKGQVVWSDNILYAMEQILQLSQQEIQTESDSEGNTIDEGSCEDSWE